MLKYIKNKLIFLLSLFFITNSIIAKNNDKPETLMWEISSQNGGKVFLLGSIHLADSTIYPLNPKIEKAFDQSQALVLEILIDKISPFDVMNYLTYKDERTLESELDPELYLKISEKFEKNNIPKLVYNKFKPWFALMYLQSDQFKDMGMIASEGIDMYFLHKARNLNKEVLEIESIQSQMQVLDELGEYTGDYLKYILEENELQNNSINELITAWKNGDDKKIEEFTNQGNDKKEFAQVMEKLNYKRNEKMLVKIEDYLKSFKTYFVVVGAAHLVGKRGIIDLITNKNTYTIKRY